tara:strand:- start:35 stop:1279 length:1245 start_codon:yes stop_codon:yes gene_type:complete
MNNLAEQFIYEDKGGKNLHLEHIEDEILNYGIDGGRASINFIQSLRDMFAGATRSSINMTVKWDGAPAIFAGIDPADGKFFVGKKSVFNVEPQLYKTNADIDKYTSGDLNNKFKVALSEFPKLGIKGVLQGDLMFTNDVSTDSIDGKKYYTFQPNTIVYAVDVDSDFGRQIKKAKIGVVWHTTYRGKDLQTMKASFGVNISGLKNVSSIWQDDATYKDISGSATFTQEETDAITAELSTAGKTFKTINSSLLKRFLDLQDGFTGVLVGLSLKTYNNTKVREGQAITNPKAHANGYGKYVNMKLQDIVNDKKSDKGKDKYKNLQKEYKREVMKHIGNLSNILEFQNAIIAAKMLVIRKLNRVKSIGTFIRTANGFKVVNPEGYVAIDRVSGNAVKLVDRMEFSYNNFTAAKAWDK